MIAADGSDPGRARELAYADALVGVGRALTTLGLRLRELDTPHAPPAALGAAALPVDVASSGAVPRGGLGPRQLAVLGLRGFVTSRGLSAADVATAVGIAQGNAQNILKRLEALGYLDQVPDERPARWHRAGTDGT